MRLLVLCVCLATAFASPSTVWENYKLTHGKVYGSPSEETYREALFQKTLDFIETHNMEADMGMHTYWVGLNDYADWTDEEYEALLGTRMNVPESEPQVEDQGPIPSNIDWRSRGAVNPMKNQGSCGSCWAFAATSSLEGIWKAKKGTLYNLSEQQLVDCSRSFGNRGCGGGWHHWAFNYIKSAGGIVETKHYRYTARDETCKFSSVRQHVVAKVTGYVASTNEAGLARNLQQGPVGVAIYASRPGFRNYRSGIYDDRGCSTTRLNHAVTAVGFDSSAWIVRNSWGTRWGNQGYILMKRGYGICGIDKRAYYPTV